MLNSTKLPSSIPTVPTVETGLLSQLPPAPSTKMGWPWTIESQIPSAQMSNGMPWPRITIVTPSYNQGEFLEETIRSVLLQNYPNLEYIVADGGSNDNSLSILKQYAPWLSKYCSEKDRGQTHAINKGFQGASGSIRGYLNSDDLLTPNALQQVAQLAVPGEALLIIGNCIMGSTYPPIDSEQPSIIFRPSLPNSFVEAVERDGLMPQPAVFWTEPDLRLPSEFNEQLEFCMDYNFWCQRIRTGYRLVYLDAAFAFYRHHPDAKGVKQTAVMWSELAGLPILQLTKVQSFEEKLLLTATSRRRLRHYLRLEIQNLAATRGQRAAILALMQAIGQDPFFLLERSSWGLGRQLLFQRVAK